MSHPARPLTLAEAVTAMVGGELSAEVWARGWLDRIAALQPRLHAFAYFDADAALAAARRCDAAPARGPLHGVPVAVKDVIAVAGMPTGMGSPIPRGVPARASAAVVRRIEAAGGYAMGKTVTAEFAFLAPGPTRNPWNPAHTPGGSSSGSAAAVAAGMVPAALGTQTNGSLIRPAAFCGVVGFKPSRGSVPNHGTLDYSPTLDQTGVFARCVADAALLAGVITGGEIPPSPASEKGREPRPSATPVGGSSPAPTGAERSGLGTATEDTSRLAKGGQGGFAHPRRHHPPTLAAVRTPVWHLAEPPMRAAFAAAVARLREAGARVDEVELPAAFAAAHRVQRCIMAFEAARHFGPLQRLHRDRISRELNEFVDEGAAISDAEYAAAQVQRVELEGALAEFLHGCDAILTPPARGEAPAGIEATGDPAFCTIWTLCGVPALALPAALGPQGLPLGIQLVGRHGGDGALLAVADWCESALGWHGEPPL